MTIEEKFGELKVRGERALILFVTAGDPSLAELPEILSALVEGGADVIEVGIPFSDPIADGPIIQASSQRALDAGVKPLAILDTIKAIGRIAAPIVTMGYTNTALRYGFADFAHRLHDSGITGSILSDLTPEEAGEWKAACSGVGVDTMFLAAPTSTDERLDKVCGASSGFVYAVSRTGVTGSASSVPTDVRSLVKRIKTRTSLPVCVGFGISTPEHVQMICEFADGAVIGSWLVDWLSKNWKSGEGRAELIQKVRALKKATQ